MYRQEHPTLSRMCVLIEITLYVGTATQINRTYRQLATFEWKHVNENSSYMAIRRAKSKLGHILQACRDNLTY